MDTELPDKKGLLLEMYGDEAFLRDAVRQFPSLRAELEELEGVHGTMAALGRAVGRGLASGDTDLPLQICRFLDAAVSHPRAVSEIENAIEISFVHVKELRVTEPGRLVLERMPESVRDILVRY